MGGSYSRGLSLSHNLLSIDHFTVVSYVPWPLSESDAVVDFVDFVVDFPLFISNSC